MFVVDKELKAQQKAVMLGQGLGKLIPVNIGGLPVNKL